MFHKVEDFVNNWEYESEATLKMFGSLTDESLTKKFNDGVRTAGRLAWHITTAIGEMMHRTDLSFKTVDLNSPIPQTAKEIVDEYKQASENLLSEIKANWKDETLLVEDNMYGENWTRGKTLGVLVTHQIHHRGQLTVLLRLAGLKVSGIYGPAKEEWSNFGMTPQE
jgi:uncharacterized damage-inducible protein DinB